MSGLEPDPPVADHFREFYTQILHFLRKRTDNTSDAAIAHAIIMLADTLGLHVMAEGVETEAHHAFLQAHGCRAFQGYLFGRPEPLAAFELRARSTSALPAAT